MAGEPLDVDARAVAIVGMAGRFPGAPDLDAYWRTLIEGREGITRFTDDQLRAAGVDPAELRDAAYVKANGVLDRIDLFDAAFFGVSPLEAEITDPQHRLFLECAWQALEDAGHDAQRFDGRIGVFAGAGFSTYLLHNLVGRADVLERVGAVQVSIANNKDYVPTRVSYKLDLKGPSVNVNTACSSSLVAVHLACQSLLDFHSDMVLAGGVGIQVPQNVGYRYHTGGIVSPDGRCRPFDARAQGTVSGNGVGIVVLRRLADALADGDAIRAVILGSAVNNDGAAKVGYTAPSVDGQAEVIAEAMAVADVEPDTIEYIETHGTGTAVGDPIEVAALTQAFRLRTERRGFCAIGSVKSNIGHLDEAAGVAGLIKTVLALQHEQLPPSLHYERPNPEIDFPSTPFVVNAAARSWTATGSRRAGVSSFGIGGTNAHIVLEEAPPIEAAAGVAGWQVLPLSARTPSALDAMAGRLAAHLREHPGLSLADVAWTLQQGRRRFEHRRAIVCASREMAIERLDDAATIGGVAAASPPHVVFLFPGQGAQYAGMARQLYEAEPVFRSELDRCAEALRPALGVDITQLIAAGEGLTATLHAQPALFAVEYALARLWMSFGVEPHMMLGHSLGEYVAATLAGVFSLEDALRLVAARAQLMNALPAGAMLAVPLGESDLTPWLTDGLSIASINAPSRSVVSGSIAAIERLERGLTAEGLTPRRLATSHAFHSSAMDPVLAEFTTRVAGVARQAPSRPWMSNVTGEPIAAADAIDPAYWARHLRQPVRFAPAAQRLLRDPGAVFLEVGPGRTLTTLVRLQPECTGARVLATSLRHPEESADDAVRMAEAVGRLWSCGVDIDWPAVQHEERRRRVPLPTYPFARQRYWIEPASQAARRAPAAGRTGEKRSEVGEWFYLPSWKRSVPPAMPATRFAGRTVVVADRHGVGTRLADDLRRAGHHVEECGAGDASLLVSSIPDDEPLRIVDCSTLGGDAFARPAPRQRALYGEPEAPAELLHVFEMCRTIARTTRGVELVVVTDGVEAVTGTERIAPDKAALAGALLVLPQERPGVTCRTIDVSGWPEEDPVALLATLAREIAGGRETSVAWRHGNRWTRAYEPAAIEAGVSRVREGGTYLITGGLGGVGLILADHLSRRYGARLALVGRSAAAVDAAATAPGGDAEAASAFRAYQATAGRAVSDAVSELTIRGLDAYPGLEAAINRLCASYVLALAARAGIEIRAGAPFDAGDLARRLRVVAPFERMCAYFEQLLLDEALLMGEAGHLTFAPAACDVPPPGGLLRRAIETYPQFAGMFELLDQCASSYPEALSGAIPAISVLYPDGEPARLERASERTMAHSTRDLYTRAIREALVALCARHPGRRIRVLEVGVGDGLLASVVVPALKDLDVEYHATDLGRSFVSRAERMAADAGLGHVMRPGVLDISRDPASQGFEAGSFDAVLALDVLHATPDVEQTLEHVRSLLAPGGLAGIVETVRAPRWVDFIWGLAEGWWAFHDRWRSRHSPLMPVETWLAACRASGFAEVAGWPDASSGESGDYGLILAQAPAAAMEPHAVRSVRRLRARGAEVLVLQADVADEAAMRTAIDEAARRFGRIDGVIHAAGVTDRDVLVNPLESTGRAELDAVLHAKATGTRVLDDLLAERPLDFILLLSSNASVLGGLGLSAYAAASRFLDAFAAARHHEGDRRWISSNWDGWPTEAAGGFDSRFQTSIDRYAMSLEECRDAFERVIGAGVPQVVVSSGDLAPRLARWVERRSPGDQGSGTPVAGGLQASGSPSGSPSGSFSGSHARPDHGAPFEAPGTETERQLAAIWETLLGVHPVGAADVFADLGGDSLLGTQLIARVEREFGCPMPFRTLFEAPTVRQQARCIDEIITATPARAAVDQRGRPTAARGDGIPVLASRDTYPLSHAQRRVWVLSQLGASAAYNIPLHQALDGPLDVPALEQALNRLAERHETLRTRFVVADGEPRQRVEPPAPVPLPVIDLSSSGDREARARELADASATDALDLGAETFRISLLRLSAERHVLLFTIHHIVCDGVSIGILVRDLAELYRAGVAGESPRLPALALQYRDYAAWQQQRLESGSLDAERQYWLRQLGTDAASGRSPAPPLELRGDLPRPAVQTFRGCERAWHLPPESARRIVALARDRQVSLFMLLGACVKVLLFRYTGQEDLVIATPVAGRTHADLEHQIGFYLNMLALRDTVSAPMPFVDLLEEVRTTAALAYDHQAYPFDRLVDELEPARDLSRSPIFDVIVMLQNQAESELALEGLQASPYFGHNGTSKADLTFNFKESARGLAVGIEYSTDLFTDERIAQMGGHLLRVLEEVTRDPRQAVGAIAMLSPEERAELDAFNDTACPFDASITVVDLVRRAADAGPGRMAVRCGTDSLTYRELVVRAEAIAAQLADEGVAPGAAVGVYLERSIDLLPALLGILSAGCAYVPLDPAFPPERLRLMVDDSKAALVLARAGAGRSALPPEFEGVRTLEPVAAGSARPTSSPPRRVDGAELAYVIYSSGSTGRPKGVAIEHRSLVNFLESMQREPGLSPDDTLLAVTTLSFDIAALELYLPLVCGAQVVVARREQAMDGMRLQALLRESGATVMQATPATWQMLLESGWAGDRRLTALCGGEALPQALAAKLARVCRKVWNMYGPTETTIWSSTLDVTSALADEDGPAGETMAIGRPIANTSMHVLDAGGQPAPAGVPGELYIGGDGLARGYVNLPGLTAERFVVDPFAGRPGARMYRTGDLAVRRADGTLDFLGRLDDQIKLRGFRIEIGEIENALLQHPAVARTAVVLDSAGAGGARLVAAVVPSQPVAAAGEAAFLDGLRQHLRRRVPDYMVPGAFMVLDDLPRTPNGKVDRKALRARPAAAAPRGPAVPPSTPMEHRIGAVWAEVLEVSTVDVEADFFEQGGHSLTAARLAFRIAEATGAELTLMDIFQHPTVTALARLAGERTGESGDAAAARRDRTIPVAPMTADELDLLSE